LITYDISDDKRRNAVFELLSDHGSHAQFSVFVCQLDAQELVGLRSLLSAAINVSEDQILIVDLGKATFEISLDIQSIGKHYDPPTRVRII
jgi:CRISPR-associated protein Cas2